MGANGNITVCNFTLFEDRRDDASILCPNDSFRVRFYTTANTMIKLLYPLRQPGPEPLTSQTGVSQLHSSPLLYPL